jgi:hypothetical protein
MGVSYTVAKLEATVACRDRNQRLRTASGDFGELKLIGFVELSKE